MVWVIGIIAVVVIVLAINGASKKQKDAADRAEFNEAVSDRAAAYADYIRREQPNSDLNKMTDSELREHLKTKMKSFKSSQDNVEHLAGFALAAAFFIGLILGATAESWLPFIALIVLGIIVFGAISHKATEKL